MVSCWELDFTKMNISGCTGYTPWPLVSLKTRLDYQFCVHLCSSSGRCLPRTWRRSRAFWGPRWRLPSLGPISRNTTHKPTVSYHLCGRTSSDSCGWGAGPAAASSSETSSQTLCPAPLRSCHDRTSPDRGLITTTTELPRWRQNSQHHLEVYTSRLSICSWWHSGPASPRIKWVVRQHFMLCRCLLDQSAVMAGEDRAHLVKQCQIEPFMNRLFKVTRLFVDSERQCSWELAKAATREKQPNLVFRDRYRDNITVLWVLSFFQTRITFQGLQGMAKDSLAYAAHAIQVSFQVPHRWLQTAKLLEASWGSSAHWKSCCMKPSAQRVSSKSKPAPKLHQKQFLFEGVVASDLLN